ncbi:MAG TPA: TlpA disulfide reductase family protein [Pyrinomonadaceae bacterium]|jgi:peroxiredoxin|nr:TlpA disulfide reductase family protein [Pyrinomonadaceae bacterium]
MLTLKRGTALLALALALAASSLAYAPPLDFRLKTTDGGEITSEMLKGDVVVLAFGASWLPLSKAQVQGVQELADQFAERNVRVYWVSTDSVSPKSKNYASDDQLRDFAKKNGLKVAVLRDPDGALFKRTGADQLPSVVIIDRTGEVSIPVIGGLDPDPNKRKLVDALSPRLNKLLGGQ